MSGPLVKSMALGTEPRVLPCARPAAVGRVAGELPAPASDDLAALRQREAQATRRMAEAQAAFDTAAQAGHAEGLSRAAQEVDQRVERQLGELADLLRRMEEATQAFEAALEREVLPVVVEAVTRAFGDLGGREEGAVAAVQSTLRRVRGHGPLTLRVAPKHLAWIERALAHGDLAGGASRITLVADANVAGGCMVDAPAGGVDASLPTQLSRLHALLAGPEASA